MNINNKIFVAGHKGMVGSAIIRQLKENGYKRIITRSHSDLNLLEQDKVRQFFLEEKFDMVFLAAARVGGIKANNDYPADFIFENLSIQLNVIDAAFLSGVKKLLFLGSSCIYPKNAPQPISEEMLLSGSLEETNEPYAIAKISGIKLCESYNRQHGKSHGVDYRSVMPTNLYGPGDSYHPENSHVIPGLIRRFHEAKLNNDSSVEIWGTGKPYREFLHVDDLAKACLKIINTNSEIFYKDVSLMCSHINVGYGKDITIGNLAELLKDIVGFKGEIVFDSSKPDGTYRKLLNSQKLINLGWRPLISLESGLSQTYDDFVENVYKKNT